MANDPMEFDEFNVRFFKYLDTPMMLIVFESDELFLGIAVYLSLMIIAAALGIVLPGGVLLYAMFAMFAMYGYMSYKKNKPNGYMINKLYRLGIINARKFSYKRILSKEEKKFKVLPYGFIREFRGN